MTKAQYLTDQIDIVDSNIQSATDNIARIQREIAAKQNELRNLQAEIDDLNEIKAMLVAQQGV